MKVFPSITYDFNEFVYWCELNREEVILEADEYDGIASSTGFIWLSSPSIISLLHELLHYIGWKFRLPTKWHSLIHKIL